MNFDAESLGCFVKESFLLIHSLVNTHLWADFLMCCVNLI
jgi:hypothetical protein